MIMGKNYSRNNVSKQRKESDAYSTPYSMVRQFLAKNLIPKGASILEPASGKDLAIVNVLANEGYSDVMFYDIHDGTDFFNQKKQYDYIITNPPYSCSFDWILQCKRIATRGFALLLPLTYLHGKRRFDIIWSDKEYPLHSVSVFTRYSMLGDELRGDGKYRTGMQTYAWFFWDK